MDPTRRVLRGLVILIAAGLGAIIAVPLALLLAAVLYLRVAEIGLIACVRFLGFVSTQVASTCRQPITPATIWPTSRP